MRAAHDCQHVIKTHIPISKLTWLEQWPGPCVRSHVLGRAHWNDVTKMAIRVQIATQAINAFDIQMLTPGLDRQTKKK